VRQAVSGELRENPADAADEPRPSPADTAGELRHVVLGAGSTMGRADALISDAVEWNGTLYLSGRADVDPATLAVRSDDFVQQARTVLGDVGRMLEQAGSDFARVLRVECYLARATDFPAWNTVFGEIFPPPRPARTTLVTGFAVPGLLIELQVTAAAAAR
jgi:2-iminobutanoate/2-iminopropanoate deaminase